MDEIAAGAGGNHYSQIPGAAVEGVLAAIGAIAPRDGGTADPRRVGIHGAGLKVDLDLPTHTACQIGAIEDQCRCIRTKRGRTRRRGDRCRSAQPERPTKIFSGLRKQPGLSGAHSAHLNGLNNG